MDFLTSLDNYNIFYEVAKCGNITKASEKLYISQPAVSQAIKKIEDNLGVSLIIRGKRGITLTPIGKKIFDKVEIALHNLLGVQQLIDEEKNLLRGELVIGAGSNIARKILCNPISEFMLNYPLIEFKIVENIQSNMIEMLKCGEINFVLTQYNEEIDFPYISVFDTQYCFVKSSKCELEKYITNVEGSYTYAFFEKFMQDNNLKNKQIMQVAGYKTALELVNLGIGTTLVPRYLVQEDLDNNNLIEVYKNYELPAIKFVVYYNPDLIMPAGKIFLEYLKN